MGGRRLWSRVVMVLAFVLTALATLLVYGQDRLFDADGFARSTSASLEDPAVNEYLADAIADELLLAEPDLAVAGSLVEDLIASILRSDTAGRLVEVAARDTHRSVFSDDSDTILLEVSDIVVTTLGALETVSPEVADEVPDEVQSLSVELSRGELFADFVRLADTARLVTTVVVVLAVASLMATVLIEPNRWRGVGRLGLVIGAVGLFCVIGWAVGAVVAASYGRTELETRALAGAWSVFFGDLRTWGWILVGAGAFLAGLSWALLRVGAVVDVATEIVDRLRRPPATTGGWILRMVAAGVVSIWAVFDPLTLVASAVRIAGFVGAVVTVEEVLRRTGLDKKLAAAAPAEGQTLSRRDALIGAAIPTATLGFLGLVAIGLLAADDRAGASTDDFGCNGHLELCHRRLDQVAMVTSHNAMASSENGFFLANHRIDVIEQLDLGVRGLMLDTWYGRPDGSGIVVTTSNTVDLDELDAETAEAVEAAQARTTEDLGPEAVYLCHGFCEIGATEAVPELGRIRSWLDDHPREVLVVIIQDATAPADTAAALDDAGLAEMAWVQDPDRPLPTLDQMIDSDRRIFVMVEEDGEGVDWLHQAFEYSQETPFSFSSTDDFSCESNRGEEASPLFVVNHFLTPARGDNRSINEEVVLGPRLDQCQRERDLLPNLVAIDFAGWGDAVKLVDQLNGVG